MQEGTDFQELVQTLHAQTRASRVSLRIDDPAEAEFQVRAEALSPGEVPLSGDTSFPIRSSPVFAWLDQERRTLVQNDATTAHPPSSRTLIDRYGVRAQIVTPVLCRGQIIGLIAVHAATRRSWTAVEVAAVESVAEHVRIELCP
jgi:GAF domain-containing protein